MCQVYETNRAFVLRPHLLKRLGGTRDIAEALLSIQEGYNHQLDIYFIKDGGLAIVIPNEFPPEKCVDATSFLSDLLNIQPRTVHLPAFV